MRIEEFNKTVLAIYDSAFDPTLWPSILERISDHTNSGGTTILTANVKTGNVVLNNTTRMPAEVMEGYMRDYYLTDLRVPKLFNYPVGEAILNDSMLTEDEAKANQELQSFFAGFELANMTGSNLSIGSNLTWLGTSRGKAHDPYTTEELTAFEALLPHVRKSVRMRLTLLDLEARGASLERLWDLSKNAILFVDDNWKVSFCNIAAHHLMAAGLFSITNNTLFFSNQLDQKKLRHCSSSEQSLDMETSGYFDSFLATNPRGDQYGVRLFLLPQERPYLSFRETPASCMITIVPLSSPDQFTHRQLSRFCSLFMITNAEQEVVHAVLNLVSLQSLADERETKIDTVRKQLKSAMMKAGVRSQRQLIQLVERFTFLDS